MKYILILLLSISFANAQVNTGDSIKANKYNGDTFHVGSVQQSILSEDEFQSLAGDCWVLMAGQTLSGTDLGTITTIRDGSGSGNTIDGGLNAMTNLPVASGRFLRTAGGNAEPVGQIQDDSVGPHNHAIQGYEADSAADDGFLPRGTTATNSINTTTHNPTGETRPENLTVNTFIKINKECQ